MNGSEHHDARAFKLRDVLGRSSPLPRAVQFGTFVVAFLVMNVCQAVWDLGESESTGLEHAARWWTANLAVFTGVWVVVTLAAGFIWRGRSSGTESGERSPST